MFGASKCPVFLEENENSEYRGGEVSVKGGSFQIAGWLGGDLKSLSIVVETASASVDNAFSCRSVQSGVARKIACPSYDRDRTCSRNKLEERERHMETAVEIRDIFLS